MTPMTATEARSRLYQIIDQANESHEPILITGKRGNAVLLSESDWKAIAETLYLMSVPGLAEDIKAGMAEPLDECAAEPGW